MGGRAMMTYLRKEHFNPDGTPKAGAKVKGSPEASLPKPEEASLVKPSQATQNKVGVAKPRKEVLKNVPDQKIIKRGKDNRSRITSRVQTSGVTKRRDVARPNLGSRVAALLKPKADKKKKEDKLG